MTYRNFVQQNDLCLSRSPVTNKNNYEKKKTFFNLEKKILDSPEKKEIFA